MSIDLQNLNEQLRELQPPSARDRLIFEAVVVQGRGQCEVAAEQGISQPRVSQIVAEVGAWLDRALPRARKDESPSGELAVGMYVAEAQIDFLLQQTLQGIAESRKDKVTEKTGTRGVVNWTETKTEGRQIAKVGLINMALRLSQAKAKLAGVDVTGKTQREMAFAEERQRREAREGEVRGQRVEVREEVEAKEEVRQEEEPKVKKPLIKKNEKSSVAAEIVQPQVQAGKEDKASFGTEEYIKNEVCKQLIKELRSDPGCAGWTDEQFRDYAQRVWDARPPKEVTKVAKLAASQAAAARDREESSPRKPLPTPSFPAPAQTAAPHPDPLPSGVGEESGMLPEESVITFSKIPREEASKRHAVRRREFLAPLAAVSSH